MLRVAVIGYGYWGPKLVRNLSTSGRFELAVIAEKKAPLRGEIARSYPHVTVVDDAMDAIRRPEIDAVVIATPVFTHFKFAQQALEQGKHVLVEKPMCASLEEAKELVGLAKRVGRKLMVDHTFLFTGAVQTIANVIRAQELGKICYFDSMRVNLGLFQPDINCLWDLAPHDLSVIDYLINDDVVSVQASGYCHVNPSIPDMVYLTLHFANDVVAHLNMSWMSPVKVRRFAVGGTSKMLMWDDLDQDQKIRIYNSGIDFHPDEERAVIIPEYRIGDIYSPRVPQQEALAGVVKHFADVIEAKTDSLMDGERGLRVVSVLELAQRELDSSLKEVDARRKRTVKEGQ